MSQPMNVHVCYKLYTLTQALKTTANNYHHGRDVPAVDGFAVQGVCSTLIVYEATYSFQESSLTQNLPTQKRPSKPRIKHSPDQESRDLGIRR